MVRKKILNVLIFFMVITLFVLMLPGLTYAEEGDATVTTPEETTVTTPEETTVTPPEETTAPDTTVVDDTTPPVEEPVVEPEVNATLEETTALDSVINAIIDPIITTDKDDYTPGEVVVVRGSGWLAGETVRLTFDEIPYNPPITYCVTADAEGNIYDTQYLIEERHSGSTITLTATGLTSGLTAQTVFTDLPNTKVNFVTSGLPSDVSISVSYSGTNNGGGPLSGTATITTPGTSSDINTQPGSQFSFGSPSGFPSSITTGGVTYNLTGISPSSPFDTTSPGTAPPTTDTITATYTSAPAQHTITVNASPGGAIGGTFNVTYTKGGTTYPNEPHNTSWSESVDADSTVTVSSPQDPIIITPDEEQFVFASYSPSASVTMTADKTITLNYTHQYKVTFDASANVLVDGTGTIVTVGGSAKTSGDLPFTTGWITSGDPVTYAYASPVAVDAGKQYVWASTSGLDQTLQGNTFNVTAAGTVTGNYNAQYKVTFAQTGLDSTATGTVVSGNISSPFTIITLTGNFSSTSFWVNDGSTVNYTYANPVTSSTVGKQFVLTIPAPSPATGFTVSAAVTVTGHYQAMTRSTGGRTLGFWSNKNGQALIGSGDLTMLRALNLVDKSNSDFDPDTSSQLKTWLLKADATYMGYMLSAQLAATELSVYNGLLNGLQSVWVDDGDGIYEPGEALTINSIMAAANLLLPGQPSDRADQEYYKNLLDKINNNLLWFVV